VAVPGGHVPVEAVVGHVEGAPVEPAGERPVPLEDGVPRGDPVERPGLPGPEPGYVIRGLPVDGRVRDQRLAPELLGGRKDAVLGEIVLDGGLGRWGPCLRAVCCIVGHGSLILCWYQRRPLRPGAPQPNAGGTLRWRGRDHDHTTAGRGGARRAGAGGTRRPLPTGARWHRGGGAPGTTGDGGQR